MTWVTDDDKLAEWGNEEVTALAVLAEYHRKDFPNLIFYLVYLALTHPIHTADVEWCFTQDVRRML